MNIAPRGGVGARRRRAARPPALLGAADLQRPGVRQGSHRRAPPAGVSAETSPGLALTPNAANGSRRFVALAGGADAGTPRKSPKTPTRRGSKPPPRRGSKPPPLRGSKPSAAGFEASRRRREETARGPGGGTRRRWPPRGGGGTPAAPAARRADDAAFEEGSGKAFMAAFSSSRNSRTDSSAVSTAKETRRFARDCLRFFGRRRRDGRRALHLAHVREDGATPALEDLTTARGGRGGGDEGRVRGRGRREGKGRRGAGGEAARTGADASRARVRPSASRVDFADVTRTELGVAAVFSFSFASARVGVACLEGVPARGDGAGGAGRHRGVVALAPRCRGLRRRGSEPAIDSCPNRASPR